MMIVMITEALCGANAGEWGFDPWTWVIYSTSGATPKPAATMAPDGDIGGCIWGYSANRRWSPRSYFLLEVEDESGLSASRGRLRKGPWFKVSGAHGLVCQISVCISTKQVTSNASIPNVSSKVDSDPFLDSHGLQSRVDPPEPLFPYHLLPAFVFATLYNLNAQNIEARRG